MARPNLFRATKQDFKPIDNPKPGDKCHIEGWAKGAVFIIDEIRGTSAIIKHRARETRYCISKKRLLQVR